MSLSKAQMDATRNELAQAMHNAGLTYDTIAYALNCSPQYVAQVMQLNGRALEDAWVIKEYLNQYLERIGQPIVKYSALKGDYHDYWFLDAKKIDRLELS